MRFEYLTEPIPITEHAWDDNMEPFVSVFNWVYNHKDFIRESIESILMQRTNFPFEIIIHDDASNDGTAEIIREYEAEYPKLFRNILQFENQWSQGKSVMTPLFEKPKGKYIALTHGDDYWADPMKLQKQVDFLVENPNYVIHYHHCKMLQNDRIFNDDEKRNSDFEFSFSDSVYGKNGYTLSMMFDSTGIVWGDFHNIVVPHWVGDWQLELFLLARGRKGFFSSQTMGIYRRHLDGIISSYYLKQSRQYHLEGRYEVLSRFLNYVEIEEYRRHLKYRCFRLSVELAKYSNKTISRQYAQKAVRLFLSNMKFNLLTKKISVQYLLKSIYLVLKRQLISG